MGARGAPKTGGRKAGSVNRKTLERTVAAQLDAIRGNKTELAKDALQRFMGIAEGAAGKFREALGPKPAVNDANWKPFGEWLDRAIYCAKELANYQSPRFRAVAVMVTPADVAPAPSVTIDHEPRDSEERERAASESYLRLVKG